MSFRAHGKSSAVSATVREQEEKRVKHVLRILRARFNEKVPTGDWNAMLRRFDDDGSGDLSKKEFVACVRKLLGIDRTTLSDHLLDVVVDHIDEDGSGTLSLQEVLDFVAPGTLYTGPTRHKVAAFPRLARMAEHPAPRVDQWFEEERNISFGGFQLPAAGDAAWPSGARRLAWNELSEQPPPRAPPPDELDAGSEAAPTADDDESDEEDGFGAVHAVVGDLARTVEGMDRDDSRSRGAPVSPVAAAVR